MRIIAVFILLFPGSQALAEVSGSIRCVVKSNTVVSISEDVTKKYTGFKDRFEVWDKLIFEYSGVRLPFDRPQTSLFCGLKDKIRNDAVINAMHHTGYSLEGDAKIYTDGLVVNSKNVGGDHISFSEDLISCEDFKADLLLKRYYKSDYEGLFTNDPSPFDLTVQIVSLDCRTIENNIQKVVDLFADK